jgi:protein-S-isoprenylcysteine O-methyltransferase Ste14
MLQFAQPWSLFVFHAGFSLQWPRMIFEERILAESFLEYRAYAASTPRIIPSIC